MVLRNLRIICLVMTAILLVAFWAVVWAPVDLEYRFGDVGETRFFLSFLTLGAALFFGLLGSVLNKMEDYPVSLVLWVGSAIGILGGSSLLGACWLLSFSVTMLVHAGVTFVALVLVLTLGLLFFSFLGWALIGVYKTVSLRSVERVLLVLVGGSLLLAGFVTIPSAVSSRSRNPVTPTVSEGQSIQAALAAYAADSVGNAYPQAERIHNYATLRALVNQKGGTLPESEARAGFRFVRYETRDEDNDGIPDDYALLLVPLGKPSVTVYISSSSILRCSGDVPVTCS